MAAQRAAVYRFGAFALDAQQRVLLRGAEPLRLTPREVGVLLALVERHGELVDRSRLMDEVWHGVSVEECNLSQHVAALRRVLGDDARAPTFIETVPRRGYRFVAPVSLAGAEPAAPPQACAPAPTPSAAPVAAPLPPRPVATASRRAWRGSSRAVIAALAAAGAATVGWGLVSARTGPAPTRTIGVLPFANLTGDSHQRQVAEALTEALVADLRRLGSHEVKRVEPVTGHPMAGIDALVETALLGGEGRLRVAAELLEAPSGKLLWAEILEEDPVGILDLERRIVRAIAARLASPPDADAPVPPAAASRREYALAQEYLRRRSPHVVEETLEHFQAAADLDPSNALAHAGLAEAYLLGVEQRILAPEPGLAAAERAARRALELDAELANAHAAVGRIAAARWDFEAAEASYRRALAIDPSFGPAQQRFAELLTVQDRHDEAIASARVARDLEPTCGVAATALAAAYLHAGRYDAAAEQALDALRLTPRYAPAYDILGWAHAARGNPAEAVAAFGEAVRLSDRGPAYVAALARAHAAAGRREDARRLLAELERSAPSRAASPLDVAEVLAALGEPDAALLQIERAVDQGAPWVQRVHAGGGVTALHDQERFRELRRRMRRPVAPGPGALPPGSRTEARPMVPSCDVAPCLARPSL